MEERPEVQFPLSTIGPRPDESSPLHIISLIIDSVLGMEEEKIVGLDIFGEILRQVNQVNG